MIPAFLARFPEALHFLSPEALQYCVSVDSLALNWGINSFVSMCSSLDFVKKRNALPAIMQLPRNTDQNIIFRFSIRASIPQSSSRLQSSPLPSKEASAPD